MYLYVSHVDRKTGNYSRDYITFIVTNDVQKKGLIVNSKRSYAVMLILCFFLGTLGIHRFYAGKAGTGILMLLTGGGFLIWWIIDFIVVILGAFKDKEGYFIRPG